jgi:Mn2+/Fe2+ NRAMP family transporter
VITAILFAVSLFLIWLFSGEGKASKIIDGVIKGLVAVIVLCFMGVVVTLSVKGAIEWKALFSGLIPDFSALFHPVNSYETYLNAAGEYRPFWEEYISNNQRNIIIGAFGTAVGINMTFLLPYSLQKKKWNKSHRELSRFDLFFGLFIPFILGASCLIISTASQFHAKKEGVVNEMAYQNVLNKRLAIEFPNFKSFNVTRQAEIRAAAPQTDKDLSVMLAKRSANDLANAMQPFLGNWSQLIFGIGILAMALSTMLVHMMMNGFAISEAFGQPGQRQLFFIGASIPALTGLFSPIIWAGTVKAALVVPASVIATTLLPIAYLIFLLLMNSKKALGEELPKRRAIINILMGLATGIAFFAAYWALTGKYQSTNPYEHWFGLIGIIGLAILTLIGIWGFWRKK